MAKNDEMESPESLAIVLNLDSIVVFPSSPLPRSSWFTTCDL